MKHFFSRIVMILFIFFTVCASASERVPVFVSIVPQKYFAEKIGGEQVDVSVMVEPGRNPHNYEPKPGQMAELSKAVIYFAVGVNFEDIWLKKFAAINRNMRIVYTQSSIEKIPMKGHHNHDDHDLNKEAHEPHINDHEGIRDPHIWLSPPLAMIQARNILTGLISADPSHRAVYETNYKSFIKELVELDTGLIELFSEKGEKVQFMAFHPAWGYFAHAYGLEQIPVELEGKDPKPAELQKLIQHAKEQDIRVIFVQPQFSDRSAKVIADAIGGQISFADPLAPDWCDNLRQVAEKFKAALK